MQLGWIGGINPNVINRYLKQSKMSVNIVESSTGRVFSGGLSKKERQELATKTKK